MKKYDAVIAGYTCVDLIPDFKKNESFANISDLLKPGKLIEIDGLNFVLGGIVSNTGLAMKKFNKKVFLNGLVGDDFIGKIAIEWLDKYNLSEGIQTTSKAGTAFSIVIAPPGIDRIFLESPGCNKIFDQSVINFDAVSRSRMFHFGYPPLLRQFYLNNGSQLVDMFSAVQRMGVVTSLDFSLPDTESESGRINWPEIIQKTLPYTDIFVPSLEELLQIMHPGEYAEILSSAVSEDVINQVLVNTVRQIGKLFIGSGVKILLIKAGQWGAYLLTGDVSSINEKADLKLVEENWNYRELWFNAYKADPLKIKNSSGAGDTSVAAFLSALLDSENPESAVKYAAMAGRNNLYCTNLYDDLSNWQEMTEEIKSVDNEFIYFHAIENK
ncbi:MAG: carbohydrate kinase family protein [Bacteroidia bacterium]|nr:carbohydrate kinase family protein [Bacteroidia bacterium]